MSGFERSWPWRLKNCSLVGMCIAGAWTCGDYGVSVRARGITTTTAHIFDHSLLRAYYIPILQGMLGEVNLWNGLLDLDLFYRPLDVRAHCVDPVSQVYKGVK